MKTLSPEKSDLRAAIDTGFDGYVVCVGASAGALFHDPLGSTTLLSRIVAPMPLISGFMLIAFAKSPSLYFAEAALSVAAFAMVALFVGCNSMIGLLFTNS